MRKIIILIFIFSLITLSTVKSDQIEEYTGATGATLYLGLVVFDTPFLVEDYKVTFSASPTPGKASIQIDDLGLIREKVGDAGKMYKYKKIIIILNSVGLVDVNVEITKNPFYLPEEITCDFPGKIARPGDTVIYSLKIINHDNWDKVLDLRANNNCYCLTVRFKAEGDYVDKISVPKEGFALVDVEVITSTYTALAVYETTVWAGTASLKLYTTLYFNYICEGDTVLESNFVGLMGEAGETFNYTLTITNKTACDNFYELTSGVKPNGWEVKFSYNGEYINRIFVQKGKSLTMNVQIDTSGESDVGTIPVSVSVGNRTIVFFATITESHKGEKGTLTLTAVNDLGNPVKGAQVTVFSSSKVVEQGVTTGEGKLQLKIAEGEYTAKIERNGYYDEDIDKFKVKMGKTTDLGVIILKAKPYAAEISVDMPSKTVLLGQSAVYAIKIDNLGTNDDTYALSMKELYEGWDYKFKTAPATTEAISTIYIKSRDTATVYLEIIPPYDIKEGEYKFKPLIKSSTIEYEEELTLICKGEYKMDVYSAQLAYEVAQGETAKIELKVTNTGNAGSLTNIVLEIQALEGWTATVTPEKVSSLKVGESQTFVIEVTPPGDIVPSDYKVSVNVKCDQLEKSEDFRITITKQSRAVYYGAAVIIVAIVVLVLVFRKYGRR
jgi:uncharacterized membrane protein